MAKTVEATIKGVVYQMPASYRASKEIAEKVGDPMKMTLAFASQAKAGQVEMSVDEVVQIIAIGCKHAGCALPVDDIGDEIVQQGVIRYIAIVGQYLTAICIGSSEGTSTPKKAPRK